jgi:hypothetical protein
MKNLIFEIDIFYHLFVENLLLLLDFDELKIGREKF